MKVHELRDTHAMRSEASVVLYDDRCVERAVKEGQARRARSLCASAIYDKVANLQLWKL